jgi:tRNA A-37 threonylcarbamoyl transferase component Bud32
VTVPERVDRAKAPEVPRPAQGGERYAIVSVLGRGGVGEVDLALDRDLGRKVAKKRLRSEFRVEPVMVQAFLEEAMITGALEHPGIVPVHDIGVSQGEGPWYTMKRLQGEALATILSRLRGAQPDTMKRWALPRLVEVFVQVLRAVAHAHQRGVVHCDLKPGNVIVGELGEVVVVDWGLAKVLGDGGKEQARAQLWSGSAGYMAREQATLTDVSHIGKHTDIWALGAILYELMVLVVPQALADGTIPEAPADGAPYAPLVPLRQRAQRGPYRREIPPALEAVTERALADAPDDRYRDVEEMLADVEAWLQGTRERERREARILAVAAASDRILHSGIGGAAGVTLLVDVTDQLVAALAEAPGRPELVWRGSALYWLVFRGLHRREPGLTREVATQLLDRLADNVVPAPQSSAIEPWIEALEEVADEAPHVRALANRVRALHAAPLFSGLGGHELLPVASAVEVKKIKAATPLFREGEPGDALWVLASGTVRVEAGGRVLNTMEPPACFGEIALLDRSTRTASVIAENDVVALTLTAERFDGLVRRHGAIAMGVMRLLAERLRGATAREIAGRPTSA